MTSFICNGILSMVGLSLAIQLAPVTRHYHSGGHLLLHYIAIYTRNPIPLYSRVYVTLREIYLFGYTTVCLVILMIWQHTIPICMHRIFTCGKTAKLTQTDGSRFDMRNDLRSPLAMYGSTMSGRLSSVSKHTPNNLRTLGWSNPSIRMDSFTKSLMFSGVDISVDEF